MAIKIPAFDPYSFPMYIKFSNVRYLVENIDKFPVIIMGLMETNGSNIYIDINTNDGNLYRAIAKWWLQKWIENKFNNS